MAEEAYLKTIQIDDVLKAVYSLLFFYLILGCKEQQQKKTAPLSVDYKVIQSELFSSETNLAGEITAESKHEHAFLVKGRLQQVLVKEGDRVTKNQRLATIGDSDYQQAMQIAQSKLDEAEDQYTRLSKMFASGSLPEADFQKIKLVRKEAQANYNLYKNKLNYTNLNAALSGVVTRIWAKTGTAVSEGQPIVEISNDASVFAKIEIPERLVTKINLNDSCKVYIRSLDEVMHGKIYKISPNANRLSRSYEANIYLDNKDKTLKDGMLCSVTVYGHDEQFGIKVPFSLITTDINQLHFVDLIKNKKVFRNRVEFTSVVNDEVLITSGLSDGDTLIVNKPLNIKEGQPVILK